MSPECAPTGARVFVYDLPAVFRDNAHYDCPTRDCAYGGPPKLVRGIEQWNSGQYNLPWMMFDRVKTSALRTTNVYEADIFFVPVWARSKRDCIPPPRLWAALAAQNPRLEKEGRKLAARHLLVDLHNTLVCSFMMDDASEPAKWFTRTNLEVDDPSWHLALDSRKQQYVLPDDCNDAQVCVKKPWHWYAFPFPTAYHGVPEQCPAMWRSRGYSRFLWSHVVGSHGTSVELRANLAKQCASSARCLGWDATSAQDNKLRKGVPKSKGVTHRFNDTRLVELMMDSTFCAQPSGDSATRKGIVDSIVFGCIPIVFVHRQTTLWLAHMSREEFLSFAVFVPEAYLIGTGAKGASVYGKADEEDKAEVFRYTRRETGVHPPGGSLEAILAAMPEAELHRRQAAMAKVAPRMLLALEDGGCDALDTIFRRMLEDAEKLDTPEKAETLAQPTASLQMPVTSPAAGDAVASNAVVMLSSSTSPKYFPQHVASVASAVLFNPGLPVHVHTAYDPQFMIDELTKLPLFQASGASVLHQIHFHTLSPRPSSLSEAKRMYRKWKLQLLNTLPARRSLYLDGDVVTCRNLEPVFKLLDEFDLVCSHSHLPHTALPKFAASAGFRNAKVPNAFTGCNGGVLGARNGSAAHQNVLQRWASCVSDGRDRYDMPCLAALMWRNPTKNYYVLPPEFNVRPSLGVPAGGHPTEPWLVHTLYGGGTVSQQLGQLSNGTCLQRLRDAGVVGPSTVAAGSRRKPLAHVRGRRLERSERPKRPKRREERVQLPPAETQAAAWDAASCPATVASAEDLLKQIAQSNLFFLHIPKCGGTTLSDLLPASMQVLKEKPPSSAGVEQVRRWQKQWSITRGTVRGMPSPWHLPPDLYERALSEPFPAGNRSVICVVRNPLERYWSEQAYRVKQHVRSLPQLTVQEATAAASELQKNRSKVRLNERTIHLAPQSWYVWSAAGRPHCHCIVAIEKLTMLDNKNAARRAKLPRTGMEEMPAALHHLYSGDLHLWEWAKTSSSFSVATPSGPSVHLWDRPTVPPNPSPSDLSASPASATSVLGQPLPQETRPPMGCLKRTIWMLWEQGWDAVPPVVRLCRDAALQLNSATWNVVLLNRSSLSQWIDEPLIEAAYRIKSTNPSDLIRFFLLSTFGGVWLDATILLAKPLDEWLPQLLSGDTNTGWLEWDDDSPRPSINFIASCAHGTLGAGAGHVVRLARAGKIRDNSYHCFNREFASTLRPHERTLRSRQLGASSNGRKEGHKLMSNTGAALGRVLDAKSNWTLQTFPYFKLTHKYKANDLRLGPRSALFAATKLIWPEDAVARAHLRGIGTWHEKGGGSKAQYVVTARGKKVLLQSV